MELNCLNRKQLEELSARENELMTEGFYEIVDYRRMCQARGEIPNARELSLIPYRDIIKLGSSYAYVHAGDLPLALVLPFYEQTVVYLPPYKKPEDFIEFVGINTENATDAAQALAHKIRKKRVILILACDPLDYENLDYLNPILEMNPPSSIRNYAFFRGITGGKSVKYVEEALQILNSYPAFERGYVNAMRRKLDKTKSSFDDILICASCYSCLCSLGYEEIAKSIINLPKRTNEELQIARKLVEGWDTNPSEERLTESVFNISGGLNRVINLTYLYTRYLSDPIAMGFCGTTLFGEKEVKLATHHNIRLKEDSIFPTEIGDFLKNAYDISFPLKPDLDIVDKMYVDSAIINMRKILQELKQKLKKQENLNEYNIEDIKKVFLDSREAILNVDKAVSKLKWVVGLISFGVLGAPFISQQLSVKLIGFLTKFGYKVQEKQLLERVVPKILGTKIDPLAVAFWQFENKYYSYKSIMDFKEASVDISKRLESFKKT